MPFSALFCLFTLLVTAAIFVLVYWKRGLKHALGFSFFSLILMIILFLILVTFTLNNMG